MSFVSASSRKKANATVSKLLDSMFPGQVAVARNVGSSTESFHREAKKKRLTKQEALKIRKSEKAKNNQEINKRLERNKKFQKLVKYNIIKSHKDVDNLTEAEEKYIKKLVKKNTNALARRADIDDAEIREEIDALRAEILDLSNERTGSSRTQKEEVVFESASNQNVNPNISKYAGLTPGLAPVGYSDDESD